MNDKHVRVKVKFKVLSDKFELDIDKTELFLTGYHDTEKIQPFS